MKQLAAQKHSSTLSTLKWQPSGSFSMFWPQEVDNFLVFMVFKISCLDKIGSHGISED